MIPISLGTKREDRLRTLFPLRRRDGCLTTGAHTIRSTLDSNSYTGLDLIPMLFPEQQPHKGLLNIIQRPHQLRSRQISPFDHLVVLQILNEILKFLAIVRILQPPAKFSLLQGQPRSSGPRLLPTYLGDRWPGDDRPHNRPQPRLPYLRHLESINIGPSPWLHHGLRCRYDKAPHLEVS